MTTPLFNTDPAFVGIEALKRAHGDQIARFESWAAGDDWEMFHASHYDWWAFPINRSSSYGLQWTVYAGDIARLQEDAAFLARYLRGVELVAASWGWDAPGRRYLPQPKPGQAWHHWPVRLHKAALSVQLFGYAEWFESLKTYAGDLMQQGERMEYAGHDLSWLFR